MKLTFKLILLVTLLVSYNACQQTATNTEQKVSNPVKLVEGRYNVGILIMDGVYNTEMTAPMDIFQHTIFREGIKSMNVFLIAENLDVVTTFEGMRILPDFSFTDPDHPPIDILVVPSAEHHLDTDLDNKMMIDWVAKTAKSAQYVTSHCDGAFILAKAGLLDDVASTTFPSDIQAYKDMFPQLDVREDVIFVHDGKYITSAGGARSFDGALYLCEVLYGKEIAQRLAKGLVIDWDLEDVKHVVMN
ncbi:MAG: DJ-1/PfpI family protein [Bacteroidota bacterium]